MCKKISEVEKIYSEKLDILDERRHGHDVSLIMVMS